MTMVNFEVEVMHVHLNNVFKLLMW